METCLRENKMSERVSGICKWFDKKKGFGFIIWKKDENKSIDVFVHYTYIDQHGYKEPSCECRCGRK